MQCPPAVTVVSSCSISATLKNFHLKVDVPNHRNITKPVSQKCSFIKLAWQVEIARESTLKLHGSDAHAEEL